MNKNEIPNKNIAVKSQPPICKESNWLNIFSTRNWPIRNEDWSTQKAKKVQYSNLRAKKVDKFIKT